MLKSELQPAVRSLPKVERPDLMTLSRDALGRYHVSFSAQLETELLPIMQRSVGVDVGLTHLATLSTGEKIANPKGLARGLHARAIHDVAFSEVRRQLTYKSDWYGKILVAVDRWYPSSKRCSECQYTLDVLRLDERQWRCPRCGTWHDRDVNAARNLLTEGLRQLAGCDDRDLRVDAGDACPEEILVQVLAEEARSGQRNRAYAARPV
jgi:transposase